MKYKAGQSLRVHRYSDSTSIKIHIMYVLDSTYKDKTLIVYKFYGKYKQWWHELLTTADEIDRWVVHHKNEQEREAKRLTQIKRNKEAHQQKIKSNS